MSRGNYLLLFATLSFLSVSATVAEDDDEYAGVRDKIQLCASCHGEKGASGQAQYPILAGQEFYYMYVQLKDFKSGLRASDVMQPIAATLEKPEMKLLARYFSEQEWPDIGFKADPEQISKGKQVVTAGQCVACHLGSFTGNSRVPRLAGQHPEYSKKTMLDFKHKVRTNAPSISTLFDSFSEEEISAVADYLGGFTDTD